MKKFLLALLLIFLAYETFIWSRGESDLPPLKDGDLVFQTTWTDQSMATALASFSLYLHTGIVKETENGPVIIEAANVVRETPLHQWVNGGIWKRFSVYRYKDLTPEQGQAIVEAARKYYGHPYDFYFSPGGDAVYCSELDYLAYKDAGIDLGKFQRIGDLNINNRYVKELIEKRWQGYPQCKGKTMTFDQCYDIIMNGTLLTPSSIAHDRHLTQIFSNYP